MSDQLCLVSNQIPKIFITKVFNLTVLSSQEKMDVEQLSKCASVKCNLF